MANDPHAVTVPHADPGLPEETGDVARTAVVAAAIEAAAERGVATGGVDPSETFANVVVADQAGEVTLVGTAVRGGRKCRIQRMMAVTEISTRAARWNARSVESARTITTTGELRPGVGS